MVSSTADVMVRRVRVARRMLATLSVELPRRRRIPCPRLGSRWRSQAARDSCPRSLLEAVVPSGTAPHCRNGQTIRVSLPEWSNFSRTLLVWSHRTPANPHRGSRVRIKPPPWQRNRVCTPTTVTHNATWPSPAIGNGHARYASRRTRISSGSAPACMVRPRQHRGTRPVACSAR